jgi:hypothetical protein
MRGRADLFENGTSSLELVVEVTIEAAVSLTKSDVRVQTKGGEAVAEGSKVVVGDALTVTASAFDYERLPIARKSLQIAAELSSGARNHSVLVQHLDGEEYRVELPSTWIDEPGEYTLRVDGVEMHFTVTQASESLYVAAGIAAVRTRLSFFVRTVSPQFCARCVCCAAAFPSTGRDERSALQKSAPREGVLALVPEL